MTTDTSARPAQGGSDRPGGSIFAPHYRLSTLGVLIIITIVAFEAMAVATALPTAARSLHGLAYYGWAFTGFLVSSVVGMVAAGWYSDRNGPRWPVLVGVTLFLAGLVVAGTAPQMWVLIVGRVLQGFAAGLLLTSMYVVIGSVFADDIRPRIFAAVASAWVVPGLVGPLVAGSLTEHISWRWVFLGLVPFVAAAGGFLVPALRQLRRPPVRLSRARHHRVGLRRISMAVLAAAGIAAVANLGENHDAVSVVAAILGLFALIVGLRALLPQGTVRFEQGIPAAVAFRGVLAGIFGGMEAVVPLTLSVRHGYSPTMAGVPLMCGAVTWAIGSWIQGRMTSPSRPRLMATGLALTVVAGLGMSAVALDWIAAWAAMPLWGLAGMGAGLALTSASVVMLESTNDADRGSDSAALQLADSSLSALSTAFVGALVALAANGRISYGVALAIAFAVLAGIAALAILRAGRLVPRRRQPLDEGIAHESIVLADPPCEQPVSEEPASRVGAS